MLISIVRCCILLVVDHRHKGIGIPLFFGHNIERVIVCIFEGEGYKRGFREP